MSNKPDFSRAEAFVWRSARLLDRHRFAHLFLGSSAEGVVSALRPYRCEDGGFGNALEPDLRAPVSQPLPTWMALDILDEAGSFGDPMVKDACDYLVTITTSDGGVPFVLPSAGPYPRAPWMETDGEAAAALLPTAGLVAILHKNHVEHPWLNKATEFCWTKIEALERTSAYEMIFVFPFLQHVPDRARAERAFQQVGNKIFEQDLVALDPLAPGEVHSPLDFAPRPDSIARPLFNDEMIQTHLEALASRQEPDGGWTFNWQDWNPASTQEWRAYVTIDALLTLRSYGMLD